MMHPTAAKLLIAAHLFIKEHGYPPSVRNVMADTTGLRSESSVSYWRDRLEDRGWLKLPGRTHGTRHYRSIVPNYQRVAFVREKGVYSVWELKAALR